MPYTVVVTNIGNVTLTLNDVSDSLVEVEASAFSPAVLGYTDSEEELTYWHTYDDKEVDAIIGDARIAIEIKSTDHVESKHKEGLTEFAKEHPDTRQILVSKDCVSRRSGNVDLYYVTDFFKALWFGEII